MSTFDEEIARHLKDAADSGELSRSESYGKPLPSDPGWDATPQALRMPMKILKDAGALPPEIEWFHQRARLRAAIHATADARQLESLRLQLVELEQKLALRLEALRINASL